MTLRTDRRGGWSWRSLARACLTLAIFLTWTVPALAADTPDSASAAERRFEQARQALWRWHLGSAEELLSHEVPKVDASQRDLLLAHLDLMRSRYHQVQHRLKGDLPKGSDLEFERRIVLGKALQALGRREESFKVLDGIATAYNEGRLQGAERLLDLAVALQLTEYPKDASEMFEEVLRLAPDLVRAKVLAAELFLEKYNFQAAGELYEEALKRSPDDVGSLLGMARIDIESERDYGTARERLDQILTVSPECVPAHNLLAQIDLENERLTEAMNRIRSHSLRLAPGNGEAIALLGAALHLADDTAGFAEVERDARATNPRPAAFYSTVGEHAARMHRYPEAVKMARMSISLDPEHWPGYVGLGIGLSRLGKDAAAKENLEKAFEGDPYNVRTFNMLKFFYDGPIDEFEWVESGPARYRLHRRERLVLSRVMPPLVQEAWDHLVAKYGVTPPSPVHIEIFPDPETFAVRSIGLPNLGAHGICFGQVITSRSPVTGDFNWAEVLWHELSHVFHIHLSRRRVPRWFTEGLAVYEATEGRPEWRREMDATLLDYREAGKLRGIANFNLSFTRARSMSDILVAYYHASRVAEYITTTHGWKSIRPMLEAWGDSKETAAVFKEALGQETLAAFDARFLSWLDRKLSHLSTSLRLPIARLAPRAPRLGSAADAARGDVKAQVEAAIGWFGRGDTRKAMEYVERAERLQSDEPRARLVRALILQQGGELDGSRKSLQWLLDHGHDGVEVRKALAELSRNQGHGAEAVEHLERAIAIDPQEGEIYHMVVALLDGLKETERAYVWRRRALAIDQASPALIGALLEGADQHGATQDEVRHWSEMARHVAPFSDQLQLAAARALQEAGLEDEASVQAHLVLLLDPDSAQAKILIAPPEAPPEKSPR